MDRRYEGLEKTTTRKEKERMRASSKKANRRKYR
jgi:hypothetical protein